MFEEMKKDPAVKIQLAGSYAGIANYWKFFDGESKQLLKYKVYEQKQDWEKKFNEWAKGKAEYETIFQEFEKNYNSWRPYSKHSVYLREGILGSPLLAFASRFIALEAALTKGDKETTSKYISTLKTMHENFLKEENIASDKNILASMIQMFYNDVDASQHPEAIFKMIKEKYGDLNKTETYKALSQYIFANSMLLSAEKSAAFFANPDASALQKDAAYELVSAFVNHYNSNYGKFFTEFNNKNTVLNRAYLKGFLEMNKGKTFYPDANFTMRVSYGHVKSYSPRDAVKYSHVCTMKGVLGKI
jgi:hypothetical protein